MDRNYWYFNVLIPTQWRFGLAIVAAYLTNLSLSFTSTYSLNIDIEDQINIHFNRLNLMHNYV